MIAIALGGKAKELSLVDEKAASLPWMSREEDGVGGSFTRGIMKYSINESACDMRVEWERLREKCEQKSNTKVLKDCQAAQ